MSTSKPFLKVGNRYIPWHSIVRIQKNPDQLLVLHRSGGETLMEEVAGKEADAFLRWLEANSIDPAGNLPPLPVRKRHWMPSTA